MRAMEILCEDYNKQLETDVTDLLIGAKASGVSQVSAPKLVQRLQHMGYSVDVNSLVTLLQNNPAILSVTPESITLNVEQQQADNSGEDTAAQVSNMAQKATAKATR